MDILKHPTEIQSRVRERRYLRQSVGVVPTMGALHDGHLSLVKTARAECDFVITTIFVNPLQFGPNEDLDQYPRALQTDLDMCRAAGADLAFIPTADDMYCAGSSTTVTVAGLSGILEGACRQTHFDGVTTVVAKLLNITLPDRAYFGQKDYQQQLIIRRMVQDLNWPLSIVTCPIVREPDGLAMSSRNQYLRPHERERALLLNRILDHAARQAADGGSSPDQVQSDMAGQLFGAEGVKPDYAVVVDPDSLEPAGDHVSTAVALLAAWVGRTRLLDNRILTFAG
jgi:pantoate--beta-alanine ligase